MLDHIFDTATHPGQVLRRDAKDPSLESLCRFRERRCLAELTLNRPRATAKHWMMGYDGFIWVVNSFKCLYGFHGFIGIYYMV